MRDRQREHRRAVAAAEVRRGLRHRREERLGPLDQPAPAQHAEAHRQREEPEDRERPEHLEGPGPRQPRAAGDRRRQHEEEHDEHRDVEQPLGHERPHHEALRRVRARRHEHDPHEVPRPRGQDVVAHVAHDGQPVGVAPRGGRVDVVEQRPPALGPQRRAHGVEDDRERERPEVGRGGRERRGGLAQRPPDDGREDERGDDPPGPLQAALAHRAPSSRSSGAARGRRRPRRGRRAPRPAAPSSSSSGRSAPVAGSARRIASARSLRPKRIVCHSERGWATPRSASSGPDVPRRPDARLAPLDPPLDRVDRDRQRLAGSA